MRRLCRASAWTAAVLLCAHPAQALTLGRSPGPERVSERRQAAPARDAASAEDARYEKIHEFFLKEDYASAERAAGAYLADPRAAKSDDVLYLQALSLVKLGRGSEAREKLRRLERTAHAEEQQAAAAVSTADSYYQDGIYASAHESYKYALEKFPSSAESPYVRERLDVSAARMGRAIDGRGVRTALGQQSVEEFPKKKK